MFPFRDHNPSGRTPYVTIALVVANVLIFLVLLPIESDPNQLYRLYADYALIPAVPSPMTFVTSMFLHAGWWHILGNMLFLWVFGDNLEDRMGHLGFAVFYLASGITAGVVHVILSHGSPVPTVGASGAIAGVMGGYLLLFPRARVDVLVILIILIRIVSVPAWTVLAVWFVVQVFGAAVADPDMGGVAYGAHAGGFLAGLGFAVPTWLSLGGPAFWRMSHGRPPHPPRAYSQRPFSRVPVVPRRRGR